MSSLFAISHLCWVGALLAMHFGHPIGYTIAIVGLAASAAIALEARPAAAQDEQDDCADLGPDGMVEQPRYRAAPRSARAVAARLPDKVAASA